MKMKNKGITLVALVITIIIMLILAGVTINMLVGDNGILRHAESSSEKYENSAEQEEYDLAQVENTIYSKRQVSQEKYDMLLEQYNLLVNKQLVVSDESISEYIIPNGIKKCLVIGAHSTNRRRNGVNYYW